MSLSHAVRRIIGSKKPDQSNFEQTRIIADVAIRMQTRHVYGLGEVEMSDSEVIQSYVL